MIILIIKICLVAVVWILGPIIDKVAEPKFERLAPVDDKPASLEFVRAMKNYLVLEIASTSLFYLIVVYWTLA